MKLSLQEMSMLKEFTIDACKDLGIDYNELTYEKKKHFRDAYSESLEFQGLVLQSRIKRFKKELKRGAIVITDSIKKTLKLK